MPRGIYDREPVLNRFNKKIEMIPECGCWIWMGSLDTKGYGGTSIKGKNIGAHRLSWQLYRGSIPNGLFVCHHCDTPSCVNPYHLFLGSNRDNILDAIKKNKFQIGTQRSNSKLSDADIISIRLDTRSVRVIAKDYNVAFSLIFRIKHKKSWTRTVHGKPEQS